MLPGNPVSCMCAYEFFAGPSIRAMGGDLAAGHTAVYVCRSAARSPRKLDAPTTYAWRLKAVTLSPSPHPERRSLSSTVRAAGCVIVPRELEGMPAGSEVEVLLYDEPDGQGR